MENIEKIKKFKNRLEDTGPAVENEDVSFPIAQRNMSVGLLFELAFKEILYWTWKNKKNS